MSKRKTEEESNEIFGSDFTADNAEEELGRRAIESGNLRPHWEISLEDFLLFLALQEAIFEEEIGIYCRDINCFITPQKGGLTIKEYSEHDQKICQFKFEKISLRVFSRKEFSYSSFYYAKDFADTVKSRLKFLKEHPDHPYHF